MGEFGVNPIVKALFERIEETGTSVAKVESQTGVGANVVGRWRYQSEPLLGNIQAALNVFGLELTVTEKKDYKGQLRLPM